MQFNIGMELLHCNAIVARPATQVQYSVRIPKTGKKPVPSAYASNKFLEPFSHRLLLRCSTFCS